MGVKRVSDIVTSDYILDKDKVTKSLVTTKRNKSKYSCQMARNKANYIAQKLDNPSRMLYYLKCAWNLSDAYIDRLLEISLTKEDPVRYFSASASHEMELNS